MLASSDSLKPDAESPRSLTYQLPFLDFPANQMLALAQWSATIWGFGQNQWSRYSTFLTGGVPLDA
ncbi:hypothetical protein [Variovorax saccharolyticus]|uniref:hypothetical protein n=1 Tax=Variovorax saccharolyticus TaxID=3053516 RepID=UPI0025782798|nr:hypothetical protein [Variovorax sp. J31P216]MDM0029620.1 hypothetical protein [Variovorax sp. J31P216]